MKHLHFHGTQDETRVTTSIVIVTDQLLVHSLGLGGGWGEEGWGGGRQSKESHLSH